MWPQFGSCLPFPHLIVRASLPCVLPMSSPVDIMSCAVDSSGVLAAWDMAVGAVDDQDDPMGLCSLWDANKMWANPIMGSIVTLDSFDKRRGEYKRLDWVYVARNPCFTDVVFEVGQTNVSPVVRVRQLSRSTAVRDQSNLSEGV